MVVRGREQSSIEQSVKNASQVLVASFYVRRGSKLSSSPHNSNQNAERRSEASITINCTTSHYQQRCCIHRLTRPSSKVPLDSSPRTRRSPHSTGQRAVTLSCGDWCCTHRLPSHIHTLLNLSLDETQQPLSCDRIRCTHRTRSRSSLRLLTVFVHSNYQHYHSRQHTLVSRHCSTLASVLPTRSHRSRHVLSNRARQEAHR